MYGSKLTPRKQDAVIPTVPPEEVPAEGGAQG